MRERLDDPPVEITISLLTAYAAYLPAEELGLSGVVAAVTVGLYMGSQTSRVTNAQVRMQGFAMWQILTFLLNSFLFVLIGLQLPGAARRAARGGLRRDDRDRLRRCSRASTVVVVRIVWVSGFSAVAPLKSARRDHDPRTSRWSRWMGMRGAVSLAAALALPLATDAGEPFAERPLILFITFCVILFTLVAAGAEPAARDPRAPRRARRREEVEENKARKVAARAALDRLEPARARRSGRATTRSSACAACTATATTASPRASTTEARRRRDRVAHVRLPADRRRRCSRRSASALEDLRRDGVISDEVMRRVEHELDLEEGRFLGA